MKHLSLILLVFISMSVFAKERVALVIGNSDYQVKPLVHPVNDARDMARVLGKLGFDVTLMVNAEQDAMELAIEVFGNKLGENTVGLFYFSGHGSQYDGENYLIPIKSMNKIFAEKHLRYKAVAAGYVLDMMQDNGLNIIILDACRDNPYKGFSKSLGRGLAQMGRTEGTLIAYATAKDTVALTGKEWERNSVYTKHLLKFMQHPNLSIESMLKKVRRAVIQETRNSRTVQRPWYEASISDEFYFVEDFKTYTEPQSTIKPPMILDTTEISAYHIVRAGDTLYSIARQYEQNISNLANWNSLKAPYHLNIGQKLIISSQNNIHYSKPTTQQPYVIPNTMKTPIPTREWKTIKAHKGGVESAICNGDCLVFSPDGKFILSGSWDKYLKLFDINTGKLVQIFKGHSDQVRAVAFSPNGQRVLSGSNDNTIKLWDISTGKSICTIKGYDDSFVYSVAFSPDGKMALSGADFPDKTMKLWNLSTCKFIRTFAVNADSIHSVAFSPDGQKVLSGSLREIKLWVLSTGQLIRTFKGHSTTINSIAFSPDGQKVLSGSNSFSGRNGETIKLWDLDTGKIIHNFEIKNFPKYSYGASSVTFSPDGRFIVSGSDDKTVKLWNVHSGKLIRTLKGHTSWIKSTAISSNGTVASGDHDGIIKLWR